MEKEILPGTKYPNKSPFQSVNSIIGGSGFFQKKQP